MPLLFKKQFPGIDCAVWRVDETFDELLSMLEHEDARDALDGLVSVKRRLERLAARVLLREAFPMAGQRVGYGDDGRPFLLDSSLDVSFSHTAGYAAVALSPKKVGIDVERISGSKALRLSPRFMNGDELSMVSSSPTPEADAVVVWSAKEAAYKIVGRSVYDFKRTISVGNMGLGGSFDVTVNALGHVGVIVMHCVVAEGLVIVAGHGW